MDTAKGITSIGLYVALLLGTQLVLSSISGIEIVTVLLLSFCYVFGTTKGICVATIFSILRCLIFGFYPSVIILYLIYYNVFAIFFGWIGIKFGKSINCTKHILIIVFASIFTLLFTLLDDIITPLFYGLDFMAFKSYFMYSLTTLVPQIICTIVTVLILFVPLITFLQKHLKNI